MILYPNIKINLGLYVTEKRQDNYHNLETVFYPVPFCDIIEIVEDKSFSFKNTGLKIDGNPADNLCVKAFNLLKEKYNIPSVAIHLHKQIPFGAGLGGGSADASFILKGLNELFDLKLSLKELAGFALTLGSDCPFFIYNEPMYATGRGEIFTPIKIDLKGKYFVLLNPGVSVSTKEAYSGIIPSGAGKKLAEKLNYPITDWQKSVENDFEVTVFKKYPEIKAAKEGLLNLGAEFALMSGSGSSVFGIFEKKPILTEDIAKLKTWEGIL